ncbi:NAD-dependent epimerase/dehydratase family protein [Actinomycetospora lutea]|uniref:NAD-dependent epimerase/dehydratase family protein n=1 Tax=Actinomycetospora lutea TaxID=663604 RepID=UPI002366C45D|nr:NAD-dependent epimerase/dehydratase family protein [Actinomycetospora lutea]MDD7942575.1 NAD-dependent epimerase/dehydratase family protein [Actinomycetospora lutea]
MEGRLLVKIAVTGSAGLVGHAVRRRLEAAGVEVVPLDVRRWSFDGVEQIPCDLLDGDAVDQVFAAERPAAVVHPGGVSGPMVSADDPARVVEVNVAGTAAVLEAARRHGVARFVYCSSIAAYGSTAARWVVEETTLHPRDVYGATKAAGEQLVEAYRHRYGLAGAALRLVAV